MKIKIRRQLNRRKRRIERRLNKFNLQGCEQPMFTASNIRYEIGERGRGIAHGGIGAIHALANPLGLAQAIDRRLVLFKFHLPYHESDHVLNIAYNALCEGTCLQDIELRRNDEGFLDAMPNCADGEADCVSIALVEPSSTDLFPFGRRAALLTPRPTKSESGCSDPPRLLGRKTQKGTTTMHHAKSF